MTDEPTGIRNPGAIDAISVGEVGAVLGTHVGPGAVGLAYLKRED